MYNCKYSEFNLFHRQYDRMFKVGLYFDASLCGAHTGSVSGTGSYSFCTRFVVSDRLGPDFDNLCSKTLHCAFDLRKVKLRGRVRATSLEFQRSFLITSRKRFESQRAGHFWERQAS